MVADIIYNFILPEVEKHNARRKVCDNQQNMQNEKILDSSFSEALLMDEEVYLQNDECEYALYDGVQTVYEADTVKIDYLLI